MLQRTQSSPIIQTENASVLRRNFHSVVFRKDLLPRVLRLVVLRFQRDILQAEHELVRVLELDEAFENGERVVSPVGQREILEPAGARAAAAVIEADERRATVSKY